MGVLRWQLVLQQRIRDALTKSKSHLADPVQVSLELGALQLLLLDRIPARAAIFESVELVRQSGNEYAVGLVNAVLRKLAQTPKLGPGDALAAHPPWMVERWIAAFGLDTATAICRYDQLPPAEGEPGSFVVRARQRVQDEGSQLIAELAGRGTEILDCCAAPGGKTAILAERNPTASITACDVSPARLKTMQALLGPRPNINLSCSRCHPAAVPEPIRFGALRRSLQRNRNPGPQSGNQAPAHPGRLAPSPRPPTASSLLRHARITRRRQAHLFHLLPGARRKRVRSR